MNYDELFTSQRWNIIEIISKEPSSPLEISQKLNTSVAYISQQLKLLEAANIVKKEKTGLIEKGMPRNVYSPVKELAYLTIVIKSYPSKIQLNLDNHQKFTLRVWALNNSDVAHTLHKLYWKIEDYLDEIRCIFIEIVTLRIFFILKDKKNRNKIENSVKDSLGKLKLNISYEEDLTKILASFTYEIHSLYDPQSFILGNKMKGGREK